jgi:hypothetical protein
MGRAHVVDAVSPFPTKASPRPRARRRAAWLAVVAVAAAALALSAPPLTPGAEAQGRPFYGVTTQGPLVAQDYNRMRRGRVGMLRVEISWGSVEPRPGDYQFESIDPLVRNAAARGIRVLPAVSGKPHHVNRPPTELADRQAYHRLMRALAERYGPGGDFWQGFDGRPRPVTVWQLWSEPNGSARWGGRVQPRAYGQLVRFGARGVRSANPRAQIVLGGMFATPSGPGSMTAWRYLNRLYKVKRIKRAFDMVGLHSYSPSLRGVRYQMRRARNVMRRNNHRRAGIRVTEIGWGSARRGHPQNVGPKRQARMLRRSYRLLTRHRNRKQGWNVQGIDWFAWQDGGTCGFCKSAGLFRGAAGERKPKRSWRAFSQMTRR